MRVTYNKQNKVRIINNWPDGHKTFEHEFLHMLKKTVNQNTVSYKYIVLIGQFWSTTTQIFTTVSPWLH